MARRRSAWGVIGATVVAGVAAVPAPADAAVFDVFTRLADLPLERAPLVPTTAPASLRPMDRTIEVGTTQRRSAYAVRLADESAGAVIALEGGDYTSTRQARNDFVRRQGYRARSTRVRGRSGLLLTRRGRGWVLLWRENGVVYWIGTGTPRRVSLAELRATANGLDRLGGSWAALGSDPEIEQGALAITTRRTITTNVTWTARCAPPAGGTEGAQYAGSVDVAVLPLSGGRFSFDLAGRDTGSLAWSGTVSGSVAADAVTMTVRATGTFDGSACDTGPIQLRLTPASRG